MDTYLKIINPNTLDGSFLRAVKCVQDEKYTVAQQLIDKSREIIDTDLTSL